MRVLGSARVPRRSDSRGGSFGPAAASGRPEASVGANSTPPSAGSVVPAAAAKLVSKWRIVAQAPALARGTGLASMPSTTIINESRPS
jgi:hypothetical protein